MLEEEEEMKPDRRKRLSSGSGSESSSESNALADVATGLHLEEIYNEDVSYEFINFT